MNNRRKLVIALGAGALTAPFGTFAQPQVKVWRVGWLRDLRLADYSGSHFTHAFARGMRELGYVEGKNLIIERRYADNKIERLPGLAAELSQLKVDVIAAGSPPTVRAAQQATNTIPIVILADGDPVGNGFVASLARPGGNITGLSTLGVEISAKHLEMLRSLVPKLSRVAVLINPDEGVYQASQLKRIQAAGQKTGVTILSFDARDPEEIDNAFAQIVRWKAGALILTRGPFLNNQPRLIVDRAARHRLPTISGLTEYVEAGGLISYGASLSDMYRRGATYVDKIFKGAADLPVEQATLFDLFINGKTAKALGLKIPYSLQIMANKVIE